MSLDRTPDNPLGDLKITETVRTFPTGRGHVLQITEKTVLKKKKSKNTPSFLWKNLKSNPSNIRFFEFYNLDNRKRVYLSTKNELLLLTLEERYDLAVSMFASCTNYNFATKMLQTPHINDYCNTTKKKFLFRAIKTKQFRKDVEKKLGDYDKWRKKILHKKQIEI